MTRLNLPKSPLSFMYCETTQCFSLWSQKLGKVKRFTHNTFTLLISNRALVAIWNSAPLDLCEGLTGVLSLIKFCSKSILQIFRAMTTFYGTLTIYVVIIASRGSALDYYLNIHTKSIIAFIFIASNVSQYNYDVDNFNFFYIFDVVIIF